MPGEGQACSPASDVVEAAPGVSFGQGTQGQEQRVGFLPPAIQPVRAGSFPSKLISLKTSSLLNALE